MSIELRITEKDELKKWSMLLESSHHAFDRLKFGIDMDTYLTYTNSVFPISLLNVEDGWRVLDIGCGWGRDIRILEGLYGRMQSELTLKNTITI